MLAKVCSAAVNGIEAYPIEVEVNAGWGETLIIIVGLPDAAVKESRDRVTTALSNSGFKFPMGRTTINLAPADIKKEGPSFDLPIALGMLAASEQLETDQLDNFVTVGELALTGAVRSCKGVLPIALRAQAEGKVGVLVPAENAAEAAVVTGLQVIPVQNLREAAQFLEGEIKITPAKVDLASIFDQHNHDDLDFADVKGQGVRQARLGGRRRRGALPAADGSAGHRQVDAGETDCLHPAAADPGGIAGDNENPQHCRPARAGPGAGDAAALPRATSHRERRRAFGGNINPTPGEISFAHHGVLFLDELPEFKRSVLETLRQPLEEGKVTISRAAGSMTFPAQFMLVAAMNPTPDGKMPGESKSSPREIQNYLGRISGPLLDRIDLHVEVPSVKFREMSAERTGETSAVIRARVVAARQRQQERYRGPEKCHVQRAHGPEGIEAVLRPGRNGQGPVE